MTFIGLSDETVKDSNVENNGFYPDISIGYIQDLYRIPSEFETSMVKNQLQLSMAWANAQLEDWTDLQREAGYTQLSELPADMIGSDSAKVLQYKHAVCSHAKAALLPQYDSMVRAKSSSSEDVDDVQNKADAFLQSARSALAALQEKTAVLVEAM